MGSGSINRTWRMQNKTQLRGHNFGVKSCNDTFLTKVVSFGPSGNLAANLQQDRVRS